MTNVKWHADQPSKISSSMKRPQGASEFGGSDDGLQNDVIKRSRPNQLLRKLRNAQRHRQAQIARPQGSSGNVRFLSVGAQPDAEAAPWPRRSVLLILVPLSIVGMVALFIMGFVGGREMVSYLVGDESAPTRLTSTQTDGTQPVEEPPAALDQPANQTARSIIPPAGADVAPEPEATPPPEAVSEPETVASVFDGYVPPSQDAEAPAELDSTALAEADAAAEESVADSPVVTDEPPSTQTAALIPGPAAETESAEETDVPAAPAKTDTGSVLDKPTQNGEFEEPKTVRDDDDLSEEFNQRQQARQTVAAFETVGTRVPAPDPVVVDDADGARLIGEGHELMAAGDVIEARVLFTRVLSSGSAEAALALGRSFDPKHLAGIRESNAKPDSLAARRWYEEWYRRSVEQGLISPNVRLERLLQAMNAG